VFDQIPVVEEVVEHILVAQAFVVEEVAEHILVGQAFVVEEVLVLKLLAVLLTDLVEPNFYALMRPLCFFQRNVAVRREEKRVIKN
jgi:hypothetical protein